jgi:transcriptional regulator with XRE-family HTH domain
MPEYDWKRIQERVGERLRNARAQKGYTQAQIAAALEVSKSTVSNWETGERLPDGLMLHRIHKYLNLSIDALFYSVDEPLLQEKPVAMADVIRIFANQREADADIKSFIETNKPKQIFLIQYSSANINNVIDAFDAHATEEYDSPQDQCKIYLLIKHPGKLTDSPGDITTAQKIKIFNQLSTLLEVDRRPDSPQIYIKCYHAPGAIRAAYAGYPLGKELQALAKNSHDTGNEQSRGLLSLSLYWYTGKVGGVVGKTNPLIHAYSHTEEGQKLYTLFENAFMALWEYSEPGETVLENLQAEFKGFSKNDK